MTFPSGMDIARGIVPGCRSFFRFGRNTAIGATYTPVTRSGHYRTPQAGSATTLRVKAGGNANDTLFRRQNILETAAPYSPMTMEIEFPQNAGLNEIIFDPPLFFPPLTDFGFLAAVASSTVDVSIGMNITEFIPR